MPWLSWTEQRSYQAYILLGEALGACVAKSKSKRPDFVLHEIMPKIDPAKVKTSEGSSYPSPFDEPCRARRVERLGDAAGLTQFGVNIVELAPGAWASQRHWHAREDEYVYVLAGELVLIEDAGETPLVAGDSAGWAAGVEDGHHLQNRSDAVARFLVVGSRDDTDYGEYSDIDMKFGEQRYSQGKNGIFLHKDGTPY